MHRRKLIIRRFGTLDFGIGYFENGLWVDHAEDRAARTGSSSLDTVHAWLACCETVNAEPIAIGDALAEPPLHVAAR